MKKITNSRNLKKIVLFALFLSGAFSATSARAQSGAHRHAKSSDSMELVRAEVKIKVAVLSARAKRENLVSNQGFEAFTVSDAKAGERIFFVDRSTKKIYEISGLPLEWRPFSDLEWRGGTLIFDRWANPHHGAHYEIDAKTRKLTKARIFNDADE
jgi:hypothetical protein